MQVAILNAVQNIVYATDDPNKDDKYVLEFMMKDTANDPEFGCDDHIFYNVCPEDETINVTGTWTFDKDTKVNTFTYNIEGTFINFDADISCILESYQGKDMIVRFQEKGTDQWVVLGIGGGLCWQSAAFEWGQAKGDQKKIDFTVTGDTCFPHRYMIGLDDMGNASDSALAVHISDTSAQCQAQSVDPCTCEEVPSEG